MVEGRTTTGEEKTHFERDREPVGLLLLFFGSSDILEEMNERRWTIELDWTSKQYAENAGGC